MLNLVLVHASRNLSNKRLNTVLVTIRLLTGSRRLFLTVRPTVAKDQRPYVLN